MMLIICNSFIPPFSVGLRRGVRTLSIQFHEAPPPMHPFSTELLVLSAQRWRRTWYPRQSDACTVSGNSTLVVPYLEKGPTGRSWDSRALGKDFGL